MTDQPAGNGRIDISGVKLVALTAMMLLVFASGIAMPFNIRGILESFETTNTLAGLVATVEMGCVAFSSLIFAQLAPKMRPRKIYMLGIITILAMNAATVFVPTIEMLYVVRGFAGLGAGAVVATVMFTAGHSRTPETTFGIINSFVGVMGFVLSQVLPHALSFHTLVDEAHGFSKADGLFFVYAAFSILALIFIRMTPLPPETVHASGEPAPNPPALPLKGWVALAGMGLVFFGHATLAMFIVQVGLEVGLDDQTIGNVFAVASVVGILAPLAAGYIGARIDATLPTMMILVAIGVFAVLLGGATTHIEFYIFAPLYAMTPIAAVPFILGAFARIDPSGRLTGTHPAFVTLGAAVAPLIGGALRDWAGSFAATGWFVVVCIAVGGLMMLGAIREGDRTRQTQSAPPDGVQPAPGE